MKFSLTIFAYLLFFVVGLTPVFAQEVSPAITPTPTPIIYELPYPGLLPGNPLYFFKMIRDSVSGFFTSNPLKKAEFDLHQTDKTIAAAQYLFNQKKNTSLVIATIARSENYFSDALQKASEATKQGMDAKDLMKRLHVANLKHQE